MFCQKKKKMAKVTQHALSEYNLKLKSSQNDQFQDN